MSAIPKIFTGIQLPLILAHRGSQKKRGYPENSIPAFREALELGASGFELDIRISKDDVLFVMHDHHLKRLTGKGLTLEKNISEEIRKISFLGYQDQIRIPTLREVFQTFGSAAYYNLEIKRNPKGYVKLAKRLIDLIDEFKLHRKVWLSSFDFKFLDQWKKMNTEIPVAFLFQYWYGLNRYRAQEKITDILHPSVRLMLHLNKFLALGKPICFWTANDLEEIRMLKNKNIVGIITDDVPLVKQVLFND